VPFTEPHEPELTAPKQLTDRVSRCPEPHCRLRDRDQQRLGNKRPSCHWRPPFCDAHCSNLYLCLQNRLTEKSDFYFSNRNVELRFLTFSTNGNVRSFFRSPPCGFVAFQGKRVQCVSSQLSPLLMTSSLPRGGAWLPACQSELVRRSQSERPFRFDRSSSDRSMLSMHVKTRMCQELHRYFSITPEERLCRTREKDYALRV